MRAHVRLLVTVLTFVALAGLNRDATADDLILGDYLLTREALSEPLNEPQPVGRGLKSLRFLTGVGGVAFSAEATSADGTEILDIQYVVQHGETEIPDGGRVRLTILHNGQQTEIAIPLHDWQALPIAQLAASEQEACFTLFGALPDAAETERRSARGERILGYHPALENTLLGLRLFQTDVLGLEWSFCNLPQREGQYLLGPSEAEPDLESNETAIRTLHETMNRLYPTKSHQSYLICDYGQNVTFSVKGNSLKLSGEPYWWCWKYSIEDEIARDQTWDDLNDRANKLANATLRSEFEREQRTLSPGAFDSKWTDEFQQARFSVIFDKTFDRIAFDKLVQPMPAYSDSYTRLMRETQGTNPTVYRAALITMRYRALFRHIQRHNPQRYAEFLESINNISPTPAIKTPTIMRPRR